MSDAKHRWTESDILDRLGKVFASPAWALIPQVRNGTGYSRARTRTADAVAVSLWPSRGIYLAGIEIKVSRSDWRKELADAAKSDEIQKYCRYWYVAAPDGVVPLGEVPETWGQVVCRGTGAEIVKAAPQLPETPPDWPLVAAVLRAAHGNSVPVDVVKDRITEAVATARVNWEGQGRRELETLQKTVRAFEESSGLEIGQYDFQARDLGEKVRFVQRTGIMKCRAIAQGLLDSAKRVAETIEQAMENMKGGGDE